MSIFFFFGNVHIYTTVVVIPTKLADDMIRWPNIWLHASYVLCSMLLIVGLLGGLIWLRLIVGLRYLLNMCDAYIQSEDAHSVALRIICPDVYAFCVHVMLVNPPKTDARCGLLLQMSDIIAKLVDIGVRKASAVDELVNAQHNCAVCYQFAYIRGICTMLYAYNVFSLDLNLYKHITSHITNIGI